ncbi:hypothetical protein C8J57DRAFT_1497119 [Mycena rebaudengoi]|nr:hypothetical protein C8J57DRAFT_1497119 [Mycena rebaudengoi]
MSAAPHDYILSNRGREYQGQNSIVRDPRGFLTFAPVNRLALTLPSEVVSEIFLHCLPDTDFVPPDPHAAPLLLCRICRQWKHIALATPGLWSSLTVVLADMRLETFATDLHPADFYCSWLQNAKSTALSLQILDNEWDGVQLVNTGASEVCKVLEAIRLLAAQWKKIALVLHPLHFFDVVPSEGTFPLLRTLRTTMPPSYLFNDAPMLRELCLGRYSALPAFPWAQLTDFETTEVKISDCVDILQHASNLTELRASVKPDTSPVSIPHLPPLTNLRILSLRDGDIDDSTGELLELFRYLTLPALAHLFLVFTEKLRSPEGITTFSHFASRSSLKLQSLSIACPPSSERLIQLLQSIPSLRTLQLYAENLDGNKICRRLTSQSDFLPNLKSLHIAYEGNQPPKLSLSTFVDMLCSRWNRTSDHPAQLRSCALRTSPEMDPKIDFATSVESDPRFQRGMDLFIGELCSCHAYGLRHY